MKLFAINGEEPSAGWEDVFSNCEITKTHNDFTWYTHSNCHYFAFSTGEVASRFGFHAKNFYSDLLKNGTEKTLKQERLKDRIYKKYKENLRTECASERKH